MCISRVCTYLHVVVILSPGQAGAGQWLSMDSEIIMKSGEPIGTQGPTGHYVLLDAHFELPSGTIRRRPVSSTHTESIPGQSFFLEMCGNGFQRSHSLPFPSIQFPFPPIPISIFLTYSHSRGIPVLAIPIPSHSHSVNGKVVYN